MINMKHCCICSESFVVACQMHKKSFQGIRSMRQHCQTDGLLQSLSTCFQTTSRDKDIDENRLHEATLQNG